MDRTAAMVLTIFMGMIVAIVAMVLDHEKKKAKKSAEPPRPPAPFRTSVLAGFSFVSGLIAVLLVIASSILSACVSMNEIARIPEAAHAPLELAAKIVLYCSILPAVGAVALAVSAWTEHPLVVLAAVLGGLIVFGELGAIPTLEWLQPYLLTSGWSAAVDALRDPLPLAGMRDATWRALCYLAVGLAATIARMLRRDA